MGKKLAISLFIVAVGSSSSVIMAAADQSLHFRAAAPAAAAVGADDLRTDIKANGLPPIGSDSIDLIASPADTPEVVTNKAARAQCRAAFATSGVSCTVIDLDTFVTCTTGPECCERFISDTDSVVNATCNTGAGTKGFVLQRTPQGLADPEPGRVVTAIASGPGGSVSHYGVENRNIYPDVGSDPAARTLIQARPGGVTGTITIHIYHNQGGSNPRTATVSVTSTNNDPTESQALHNNIETALETISPALPIPIVATTRTRDDHKPPLTWSAWFKQADHSTEITNMAAAAIREVRVIVPAGVGLTVLGTDNMSEAAGVPTLNEWGIVVLVVLLLLSGYLLMRRQRAGTATT